MIEAGDMRPLIGISISSRTRQRALQILEDTVTEGLRIRGFFSDKEAPATDTASEGKPVERTGDTSFDLSGFIHLETGYNCGGYGLFDEGITETIDRMLKQNSIPMDPTYTGKAFAGMIRYLADQKIRGENILFLHTGGLPLFFDHLAGMQR
jgi:D-cysteine desulfhydrase